jgi:hypothetical protein
MTPSSPKEVIQAASKMMMFSVGWSPALKGFDLSQRRLGSGQLRDLSRATFVGDSILTVETV